MRILDIAPEGKKIFAEQAWGPRNPHKTGHNSAFLYSQCSYERQEAESDPISNKSKGAEVVLWPP